MLEFRTRILCYTEDGQLVRVIHPPNHLSAVGFLSNGHIVVVEDRIFNNCDRIAFYDAKDDRQLKLIDYIDIPMTVDVLAVHHNDDVYFGCFGSHKINVLTPNGCSMNTMKYQLPIMATAITTTVDGYILMSNSTSSRVYVYSLSSESERLVSMWKLSGQPSGLTILPHGRVAVCCPDEIQIFF